MMKSRYTGQTAVPYNGRFPLESLHHWPGLSAGQIHRIRRHRLALAAGPKFPAPVSVSF